MTSPLLSPTFAQSQDRHLYHNVAVNGPAAASSQQPLSDCQQVDCGCKAENDRPHPLPIGHLHLPVCLQITLKAFSLDHRCRRVCHRNRKTMGDPSSNVAKIWKHANATCLFVQRSRTALPPGSHVRFVVAVTTRFG